MNKFTIIAYLSAIILFLSGCQTSNQPLSLESVQPADFQDPKKIHALVSILPQTEFVKSIGGDNVEVVSLVREGFNPATYEPTPDQLKLITQADIYFLIGHVAFEKQYLQKIIATNPDLVIVDTSEGINLRQIDNHGHEDLQEDSEAQSGDDPHIWLSPVLIQTQIEHIYQGLVNLQPENIEKFGQNKRQYSQKLQDLHQELTQSLTPFKGQTFFVYHPAFGYLADQYGLNQEHIEIDGKEPSAADITRITKLAKNENIHVIFVQKQFSTQAAEAIAEEINGSVIALDPLNPHYIDNMYSISQTISRNLSNQ